MRRVVIVVDTFAPGGHTSSLLGLLRRWADAPDAPELDVVTLSAPGSMAALVPPRFRLLEMPRRWPIRRGRRLAESVLSGSALFSMAIRLQRRSRGSQERLAEVMRLSQRYSVQRTRLLAPLMGDYDVAIAWSELGAVYALVDKVSAPTKVAWIHPDYRQAAFDPRIDAPYFARLDYVVAVSCAGRNSLAQTFPELAERFLAVRNVVDSAAIASSAADGLGDDGELFGPGLTFVTVCRLHDQSKALLRAVRLCAELKRGGRPVRWIVVGEGPDRALIEQATRDHEVTEEFLLVGARDNPYPYIVAADLFVLQSYYEGMPMAVDEAIALGIPVLVTDFASAHEQVRDGVDGWVVPNHLLGILAALIALVDAPDQLDVVRSTPRPRSEAVDDYERVWKLVT